jgi:alkanesulfonate monooxygenase SsuD/methylene tetrahydromethanopterin reductase-like flavin-dependent oxidoreductase (luciferase family)
MSIAELHRKAIVGSSEQVATRLKELAKSLELDELVVVTWTYDLAPRHRSFELLAEAFGLGKLVTDSFAVVTPNRIGRTFALED